jgi:cytoskeletal protein CcmA (bactofilin family)
MTDVQNDTLDEEDFDTVLSPDIQFTGTLNFKQPFLIKGRVSGEIISQGLLVVDDAAIVEADIQAPRVIIRGSVQGNVSAAERVEIAASGTLVGDVRAPEIFMETGCVFNGSCVMSERIPSAQ